MNTRLCKSCDFADIDDDCIKCLYGTESYPSKCPDIFGKGLAWLDVDFDIEVRS